MSVTEELLSNNETYASSYDKGDLPATPGTQIAIVACMDARLNVYGMLGLSEGDAHVIRNAGGVVTDDVVRSLMISQRLLRTSELMLIHHADCGMRKFKDDQVKEEVFRETGLRPPFALEAFADTAEDVRQSIARLRASPFVAAGSVRGFVYDEKTGRLEEVTPDGTQDASR